MDMSDALSWLLEKFGDNSSVRVEVVPVQPDPLTGERTPLSVGDISVDPSDREVHLLVNLPPGKTAEPWQPMTVAVLIARLKGLSGCDSYRLVSGTWRDIDEDHIMRIDWPFEGVAISADATAVGFVERVMDSEAS